MRTVRFFVDESLTKICQGISRGEKNIFSRPLFGGVVTGLRKIMERRRCGIQSYCGF